MILTKGKTHDIKGYKLLPEDAPDVAMEILSPSTAYYDIKKEYRVYEKYGVKEYWIVDPEMKCIEIFLLNEKGEFYLSQKEYEKGFVNSAVLKEFEISLGEVFAV